MASEPMRRRLGLAGPGRRDPHRHRQGAANHRILTPSPPVASNPAADAGARSTERASSGFMPARLVTREGADPDSGSPLGPSPLDGALTENESSSGTQTRAERRHIMAALRSAVTDGCWDGFALDRPREP